MHREGLAKNLLGVGRGIVALVVLMCLSCPDATPPADADADADTDTDVVSVDTYCTMFVAVLRAGYEHCCTEAEQDEIDDYLTFVEEDCVAGEISSVRAGHATLDTAVAQQCFDAYERDFEDCNFESTLGESCRYRWYGFGEPGDTCRDVWYCERGLGCVGDFPDGVCTELPVLDESCGETAECAPGGLYCSYEDWTCHREPVIGETCEREEVCAAGRCIDGTCQAVPVC